jgi:hypothetical protein
MLTYLLKSALPFTLTFILGAALGGFFFNPFGVRTRMSRAVRTELRSYSYGEGRGCKHRRFRQRELVAESKPLIIHDTPPVRWPRVGEEYYKNSVWVRVTFGADGKVQEVKHLQPLLPKAMLDLAERAARLIYFEPETINGVPVTVTKDVEVPFSSDVRGSN